MNDMKPLTITALADDEADLQYNSERLLEILTAALEGEE